MKFCGGFVPAAAKLPMQLQKFEELLTCTLNPYGFVWKRGLPLSELQVVCFLWDIVVDVMDTMLRSCVCGNLMPFAAEHWVNDFVLHTLPIVASSWTGPERRV